MSAANLVYMLVKVEFGRIPNPTFMKHVDEITDLIRNDYPIAPPVKKIKTFQVDMQALGQPEISESEMPMMTFLSPTRDFGIRIGTDFIVIHTKNYLGFNDLAERIHKVLPLVMDKYSVRHYSFLGMRYINKIIHDEVFEFSNSVKRTDFLQPKLCEWARGGSNMASNYLDVENNVAVRINSGIMVDAPILPADLAELASDFIDANLKIPGPSAHVDIDVRCNQSEDIMQLLDIDEIFGKMCKLRNVANKAYQNIIKN